MCYAEPDTLGSEYMTRERFAAMTLEERFDFKAVTGNGEQDFEKLLRRGCIDGRVDDAQGWRREIRRRARQAGVQIRTYRNANHVVAHTLHYQRHLAERYAA